MVWSVLEVVVLLASFPTSSCREYSKYFSWVRLQARRFGVCRVVLDHKWGITECYFYLGIIWWSQYEPKAYMDIWVENKMMQKWMIWYIFEHVGCTQYTVPSNMAKRPQSIISRKFLLRCSRFFMSPLHEALNFENVTGCGKNDYPLQFCAHCWIENEVVARRAQVVWPKLVEVLR